VRELILDDMLERALAGELRARGRPARTVADLGLEGATDAAVAEAVARADGVLVTTVAPLPGALAAAVLTAGTPEARREAVHRHAHEMAGQRPGSLRSYGAASRLRREEDPHPPQGGSSLTGEQGQP